MGDERQDKNSRGKFVVGIHMGKSGSFSRPVATHWGIVWGGIIVFIGLVILLDNMGIIAASRVFRFWPLLLIGVGILNLATQSSRVFGIALLIVGILFQLHTLGIARFTWGEMWALALIVVGLLVMWSSLQARKISATFSGSAGETGTDLRTTLNEVAIFGGVERKISSPDFRGGTVNAIFGGVELDLRDANMQQDEAKLEVNAVFGGVELRVPESWQVVSRGQAIFGGFVDETRNYRPEDPANLPRKALILTGSAVFGGVEIKN
jgi:predicted membrane protein